jgi:hypothetical protein
VDRSGLHISWIQVNELGVNFKIFINEGKTEKVLFSRCINPKVNENERRWIDNSIDLLDYGG